MNWLKLLRGEDAQRNPGLTFENIALPRFPGAGEISQSAGRHKLGKECSYSYDFGIINPVFDLTLSNRGTSPAVLSAVGMTIETVAHSFFVGGVVELRTIDISFSVMTSGSTPSMHWATDKSRRRTWIGWCVRGSHLRMPSSWGQGRGRCACPVGQC